MPFTTARMPALSTPIATLPSTPAPELDTPHYMHSTRLWAYAIRVERGSRTVVFPVTNCNLVTLRSVRRPCSRSPRRSRARRSSPPWVATRLKCTVPILLCASAIQSISLGALAIRARCAPPAYQRAIPIRSIRRSICQADCQATTSSNRQMCTDVTRESTIALCREPGRAPGAGPRECYARCALSTGARWHSADA